MATLPRSDRPTHSAATYSLRQFSDLTCLPYGSVWSSVHDGTLPVRAFRIGRRWLLPRAEVDALLGIGSGHELASSSRDDDAPARAR